MDRLTEYHCGIAVIKDRAKLAHAMKMLAAYEETGLEPEEIQRLKKFVLGQKGEPN